MGGGVLAVEPPFEPEHLVAALNEAGIGYVIVGGLAVGAHGVVRATRDLDLVADPSPENLRLLADTLAALGASHPVEGELTGPSLGRPVSMKLQTRHGEVHVLNRMPGTPEFRDLWRDRLLVEIETGVDAPISSMAHLRAMKRASERPPDAVDLAELEELHGAG